MVLIVQNNLYASDKFAKRATYEFFSALFLLLVGSGPKKSMAIENWAVLRWFLLYFKGKENRTAAYQDGNSEVRQKKKKCSRHLIYARACVNKDFVQSGSLGLI